MNLENVVLTQRRKEDELFMKHVCALMSVQLMRMLMEQNQLIITSSSVTFLTSLHVPKA